MDIVIPGKYVRLKWWHLRRTFVGVRRFGRIYLPRPGILIKLWANITDEDMCQRGPDNNPLGKLTPFVPFRAKE